MTQRQMLRRTLLATVNFVAPLATARRTVARELTGFCRNQLARRNFTVALKTRRTGREKIHALEIVRRGDRIELSCLEEMLVNRYHTLRTRIPGVLAPIAMAPTDRLEAIGEISDGEESGPGVISFCSHEPRAILVPDDGFVTSRGYERCRQAASANCVKWNRRIDQIIWRGSTNGSGLASKPQMSTRDLDLLPRVRLCLELRGMPGTDVKISNVVQAEDVIIHTTRLGDAGILASQISPLTWHACKFALDIDGNSNAWSNFFMRLLMGCCVLKIASPTGYRQWYYHELEAWTHYVPVAADLSDLRERIAWCRANLDHCRRIAVNGQAFAMARDYDTELARSARRVDEAYKDGALRTRL